MIVRQWADILDESKTQTRRLKDSYQVGKTYAVVPKRGRHAIWYFKHPVIAPTIWHEIISLFPDEYTPIPLPGQGWQQLRVNVLQKWQAPLWDITEAEAIAEGIHSAPDGYYSRLDGDCFETARACYRHLWDNINGTTKGARWGDDPLIWVYRFELVKGEVQP